MEKTIRLLIICKYLDIKRGGSQHIINSRTITTENVHMLKCHKGFFSPSNYSMNILIPKNHNSVHIIPAKEDLLPIPKYITSLLYKVRNRYFDY